MKILSLIFTIIFINCYHFNVKTFRKDREVRFEMSRKLVNDIEIEVDKSSMVRCGTWNERFCWYADDLYQMLLIDETILHELKEIALSHFQKEPLDIQSQSHNKKLKIIFNYQIDRPVDKESWSFILRNILSGITLGGLIPLTMEENHTIIMSVLEKDKKIYEKTSEEKSYISISFWYIFLLHYYSSPRNRSQIFKEHSAFLLNDFQVFYLSGKDKK